MQASFWCACRQWPGLGTRRGIMMTPPTLCSPTDKDEVQRELQQVYCAHTSRFTQGPPLPPSLSLPCLLTFIVHQLHSQCVSAPFHKLLQSPHVHHLWAGEPLGAWQGTWKMKRGDVSKTADCAMLFPIITVQIRVTNDFWLPRQLILSASQQSPPLETLASPGGRVVSGRMPFGSRWLF